jgi:hypothetical protein
MQRAVRGPFSSFISGRQLRAFAAGTGQTPAKAVEKLGVETVRLRVEDGTESLEAIAPRYRLHRSGAPAPRLRARLRPAATGDTPRRAAPGAGWRWRPEQKAWAFGMIRPCAGRAGKIVRDCAPRLCQWLNA